MTKFIVHFKLDPDFKSWFIMGLDGQSFARAYIYDDEPSKIYLDWLSVNTKSRKQGIGTKLQEMREDIGRQFGCQYSILWVEKGTWMYDWYQRRGYHEYATYEHKENCVWMNKEL